MKILKVIHGYPMKYNAGSEVYSQTLCHGLSKNHEVKVFTREEDSFKPEYAMTRGVDSDMPNIELYLVNMARARDGYRHQEVDNRFREVLLEFKPDLVHIGHLNHLSTSLLAVTKEMKVPVVYTLHDYWLMCPRGQFMQTYPENTEDIWAACEGQGDRKCALRCYRRYFSGAADEYNIDLDYWSKWVSRRMVHVRDMIDNVDLFLAPAKYLAERYKNDFEIKPEKIAHLDYGFDLDRLKGRSRKAEEIFTFGYIGTHIPAKGIHYLIEAFGKLKGKSCLRIWGRARKQDTQSLKAMATSLPPEVADRVQWMTEYKNREIVRDVFNHVDCIVVPSVWVENSPLVIHEALQAGVPVITANAGGMAEYIKHEVNGLLFEHRKPDSLSEQMQRFEDNPELARNLGRRGYLQSEDGSVPEISEHVRQIEKMYRLVMK